MDLTMKIFKKLLENEDDELDRNFMFSPVSTNILLSIVASGLKPGPTLDRLLSLLGFKSVADLNAMANSDVGLLSDPEDSEKLVLSSVNSAWVDKRFKLNPNFKQLVKTVYHTNSKTVDFWNKPNEAKHEINKWAEEATLGLIKNLVSALDEYTILMLANALYFKGTWYEPFDVRRTKNGNFYTLDGDTVRAPYLRKSGSSYQYASLLEGFKILRLKYKKERERSSGGRRRFSMYLFLPNDKDGLFGLMENFSTNPDLLNLEFNLKRQKIETLKIPKFRFRNEFEVSKTMKELGVEINLKRDAEILEGLEDLSMPIDGMKIVQSCCIEVDEEGTKAAAVSHGRAIGCPMNPPPPTYFIADHPFIFMIREDTSTTPIFLGAVVNPLLE